MNDLSKNKILILVPHFGQVGGVSNYYSKLQLNTLKEIDYFFVNSDKSMDVLQKTGSMISIYFNYLLILWKGGHSIVHSNPSLDIKSFYRDSIFIGLAMLTGKKTIVFFRGWEDSLEEKIKRNLLMKKLFMLTYARADKFIVLGSLFKNKLISLGVPASKEFFIESTLADDQYLDESALPEKQKTFDREIQFLFLSRIEKEKGVYIAIDAFVEVCKQNPDKKLKFIIAGEGNEKQRVEAYLHKIQAPGIQLVNQVTGIEKAKLLNESHLFFFPTYYGEGLPNCILEAMLFAMPVVSRNTAAIPDVVEDGVNGFLSSSKEAIDFVPLLNKIIRNKELYLSMSEANCRKAKENFTKEKITTRLLKIYSSF